MKIIRPETEIRRFVTVGDGMKMLIVSSIQGQQYDLITVSADDRDESLWLEVVVEDSIVQIPLALVKEVIEAAEEEVHSEAWYEKHVYPDQGT